MHWLLRRKNLMPHELDKTPLPYRGKFLGKTFDDMPLRDLDWLVDQPWCHGEIKTKLKTYLADPVIKRELERELGE